MYRQSIFICNLSDPGSTNTSPRWWNSIINLERNCVLEGRRLRQEISCVVGQFRHNWSMLAGGCGSLKPRRGRRIVHLLCLIGENTEPKDSIGFKRWKGDYVISQKSRGLPTQSTFSTISSALAKTLSIQGQFIGHHVKTRGDRTARASKLSTGSILL